MSENRFSCILYVSVKCTEKRRNSFTALFTPSFMYPTSKNTDAFDFQMGVHVETTHKQRALSVLIEYRELPESTSSSTCLCPRLGSSVVPQLNFPTNYPTGITTPKPLLVKYELNDRLWVRTKKIDYILSNKSSVTAVPGPNSKDFSESFQASNSYLYLARQYFQ